MDVNDKDSEFVPTTQTIGSESYNVPMKCVKIGTNDVTMEKHSESTNTLLGDIVIQNKTILEFHKVMKSVPKTKDRKSVV